MAGVVRFACVVAITFLVAATDGSPARPLAAFSPNTAGPLLNGDFELGNLGGWKRFMSTNGWMETATPKFDTNGDGSATYSAEF